MSKRVDIIDALNSARRMVKVGHLAAHGSPEQDDGTADSIADALRIALDRIDEAIEIAER
ncbi:MAG: hypothetical protein RO009_17175 [Pseudorhodoplanes sp.]|jgi:hypothetical protein|nr:hypothetical protein [Pseudorhodoplanes sp.]